MGKLRACLASALVLAACGDSNKGQPDAPVHIDAAIDTPIDMPVDMGPTFDFSCMGNPAPTTADAMVTISGTATEVSIQGMAPSIAPLADAAVVACKGDCLGQNRLATATSDMNGAFTLGPIATGGTPLPGYVNMTHANDRTVFAYPATPVTTNVVGVPVLTFTPAVVQALALVGCTQSDANGMLGIVATDCAETRITDSTNIALSVKQNGTDVAGTTTIDAGQLSNMAAGLFIVCNVPPGTTNVGAAYRGTGMLAHDVEVTAGTTTETQVRPGY